MEISMWFSEWILWIFDLKCVIVVWLKFVTNASTLMIAYNVLLIMHQLCKSSSNENFGVDRKPNCVSTNAPYLN